jgi:hypothetical protein
MTWERERCFVRKIQWPFRCQVSSASLIDVSAGNCQRAQVDESGMISSEMGRHNRSEIVVGCLVHPPHKDKGSSCLLLDTGATPNYSDACTVPASGWQSDHPAHPCQLTTETCIVQ